MNKILNVSINLVWGTTAHVTTSTTQTTDAFLNWEHITHTSDKIIFV